MAVKTHQGDPIGKVQLFVEDGSGNPIPAGSTNAIPTSAGSSPDQFVTTTPLGGSASFTSPSIDGSGYRRITGVAMESGGLGGNLHFEHSRDGSTWRRTRTLAVGAGGVEEFDEPLYRRYVRLVYVNGANAQSGFELDGWLRSV